ncbi:MAG: helix-turn-helix transcriptional regulator [Bdellovibrionales bacterium]
MAQNIVARRKVRGWSQSDLADRVGVHVNTIKSIETDESEGSLLNRQAIAGALECSLSDLYNDSANVKVFEGILNAAEGLEILSKYQGLSPSLKALACAVLYEDPKRLRSIPVEAYPLLADLLKAFQKQIQSRAR